MRTPRSKEAGGATIVDVAREAGVSIKTVSRVVNAEAGVHEETKARVLEVVQRLHYRPKASARSLAGARSFLIGLFYYDPQAAFAGNVQRGATRACREAGYHLVVESLERGAADTAEQVERTLAALRPDGVILTPPLSDDAAVLATLAAHGTRVVRLSPRDEAGLCVRIDDVLAAEELTRLLIGLGHQQIAFLRGPSDQVASERRYLGFQRAMKAARLKPAWVFDGNFNFDSGVAAAHQLLALGERPTAVFAANDDMALGLQSAAEGLGLRVPQDLSLVGFDDSPAATLVWPALTTVRQPLDVMAATAVQLLLAEPEVAQSCVLPHEIKVRASTAALHPPPRVALPRRR